MQKIPPPPLSPPPPTSGAAGVASWDFAVQQKQIELEVLGSSHDKNDNNTELWLAGYVIQAAAELTEAQEQQIFRARRLYYQHFGILTAQRMKIAPWLQVRLVLLASCL